MRIGHFEIGAHVAPFIIAEMSGNHNQSLERALEIVELAAKAGCQALKLQTYRADTITLNVTGGDFEINDKGSLWSGQNLYDLYSKAYTPWEWHKPIFERAKQLGMVAFSSPFDETAVDFLETLDVPAYKIASFENNHLPLIKKVAQTGKPMIISTGMASIAELDEAVTTARNAGAKNLILLKCTSTYPASPATTNLATIPHMRALFNCEVGLSDHTMGIGVSVAAVALGASVIEKHFCISRAEGGVDSAFSMEPLEMEQLVFETAKTQQAIGNIFYGATSAEAKSVQFRRSLYLAEDVAAGEVLTAKNLRIVRPGLGLAPKFYETLLGKKITRAAKKGDAVTWEMFS